MPVSSHTPKSPLLPVISQEPGTAEISWNQDTDEITVLHADTVIRVCDDLLKYTFHSVWDGEILTLDTAGTYCYHRLGPDPDQADVSIFSRIF